MIEYATSEQLTGTMIGAYRLEQLVGQTNGGAIFLASTQGTATKYALRLFAAPGRPGAQDRQALLERFHSLAGQIVRLQHAAILPLLDYGFSQDRPYLVSPYIPLRSLRRRLATHGPMHILTVGHYLDQIAAALEYAHKQSVFHGQLTLDCIFDRPDGRVVIADFGVRRLLRLDISEKFRSPGSEASAPEQLLGRPTGAYTDVYALGAVIYQLLTGSPAFAGPTAFEVAQQHLFASVPPLSQHRSDLPAGLDSIIGRALAKEPQQRFQQAGALAHAYHKVVNPNDKNPVSTSLPAAQVGQSFVIGTIEAERQLTTDEWNTNTFVVYRHKSLRPQEPETPLPLTPEDVADGSTLKRIPALLRQVPVPSSPQDLAESPTLKRIPALLKQTPLPSTLEDVPVTHPPQLRNDTQVASPPRILRKYNWRTAVIMLLLVLVGSVTIGMVLIFKQSTALPGLTDHETSLVSPQLLLGLCIIFAIAFNVAFNLISRASLSTTRHEGAYTILWQLGCALLAPLFLPFDRFSITVSPNVLLLIALSVVLWALVDAFQFSAFKYEEASVLSAIFPLNFVFTFVVSVLFFHSVINPPIVVGFLIIMAASLLIGVRRTRLRPSKGVVFGLLCSFLRGIALGFNSEVVKSFSIAPNMFLGFLFPALVNQLFLLRPKRAELLYELKMQWKKILLNAVVMDAYYFFLLKAFQLGNVPQVVALSASSTLLTALAGVVILKEDNHIALKIIAAGMATLGLVLLQI